MEDVVVSIKQFEEVYQVVDKSSVEIRDVAGYVRSAFSQFSESLTTFRRVYTEVDVRVVSVRSALKDCGSISVLRVSFVFFFIIYLFFKHKAAL